MKRRQFLERSLATVAVAAVGDSVFSTHALAAADGRQQVYELRLYRQKSGADTARLEKFLQSAAIPAWNRLGISPVGVFKDREGKEPGVFVLLPYSGMEMVVVAPKRLGDDLVYLQQGSEYLQTAKGSPGFERIDSWLLLAFAGMPRLELAPHSRNKVGSRLFELRMYESYSELKAAKKVDMFNDGEIDLMKEVGLAPVFFGAGIVGANLPHLIYMTSGESEEAHKQHWDAFVKHPKWDKMKNDPQYADTVSKITKWMLNATSYSQI